MRRTATRAWSAISGLFAENPVLWRELRSRQRGGRGGLTLAVCVGFMALTVLVLYFFISNSVAQGDWSPADLSVAGRRLWFVGAAVLTVILLAVVPGLTCGAITREREREMLPLLMLTLESPARIAFGKALAGALFGWSLVLASVPPLSIALVLGGLSPGEVALTAGMLLCLVAVLAGLGLCASAFCGTTRLASGISYLLTGLWTLGLPISVTLLSLAPQWMEMGEGGMLLALAAWLAASAPGGFVLGATAGALVQRRAGRPLVRAECWGIGGLGWLACTATIHVPGAADLLLSNSLWRVSNPVVVAVMMVDDSSSGSPPVSSHLAMAALAAVMGLLSVLLTAAAAARLRANRAE